MILSEYQKIQTISNAKMLDTHKYHSTFLDKMRHTIKTRKKVMDYLKDK